jgi:tetratricopeptide (TPR) repeat protein
MGMENEQLDHHQIAGAFAQEWNELIRDYPRYRLDFEWPSVGVLDSILFALRGTRELSEDQLELVFVSACYLAVIIERAWDTFRPRPEVIVNLDRKKRRVLLTLSGGGLLGSGQQQTVELFEVLSSVLRAETSLLPVYRESVLTVFKRSNLLSPVMAGLAAGASPWSKGPLLRAPLARQQEAETPVSVWIGESTNRWFTRQYPLEDLDRFIEPLSLCASIPPDSDGGPPLVSQVAIAWEALEKLGSDDEERLRIIQIWADCPDDTLGKIGIVLKLGILNELPEGNDIARIESLGVRMARLRHAIYFVRRKLGVEGDWVELRQAGKLREAQYWLDVDYHLGLMPLLVFPAISCVENPDFFSLVRSLAAGTRIEQTAILPLYEMIGPQPAGMYLQYAFLLLTISEFDRARACLDLVSSSLDRESVDCQFWYYAVEADYHIRKTQFPIAARALKKALEYPTQDLKKKCELAYKLFELRILLAELEGFPEDLERALQEFPHSPDLLRLRAISAYSREESDLLENAVKKLYRSVPFDPEVIALIRNVLLAQ